MRWKPCLTDEVTHWVFTDPLGNLPGSQGAWWDTCQMSAREENCNGVGPFR